MKLRALIVEDSEDDAELVVRHIKRAGIEIEFKRVDNAIAVAAAMQDEDWDVVISDYSMPGFNGIEALRILKKLGLDTPFILISGTIGEEVAVQALKAGANDYLMKGNLIRLVSAIEREIRDAGIRRSKARSENERIILIERLQEALRARDEFLLIAAHELKTPVTSLLLHARLMQRIDEQGLAAEVRERRLLELRGAQERQAERLARLIENLLDVSRISVGRLTIEPLDTDLVRIAHKVVDSFREEFLKENCQIEVIGRAPVVGYWDPLRMEQVLVNLVGNALKHSKTKTMSVLVENAGEQARLTVTDHGVGIAKADEERLFRRFERGVSSDHVGGLGLGLYIAREIVIAHGGSIRLESELGKGATFIISVPKRKPSQS